MPIAFSDEEKMQIRERLLAAAEEIAATSAYKDIKVEALTTIAGISKGAFYKFYESKEQLFFEMLMREHHRMFAPSIEILKVSQSEKLDYMENTCANFVNDDMSDKEKIPIFEHTELLEEKLYKAIFQSTEAISKSKLETFWTNDAPAIIESQIPDFFVQRNKMILKFVDAYLSQGKLKVSQNEARHAVMGLIFTYQIRKSMGSDYKNVLRWMVHGVCESIFTEYSENTVIYA